MREQYVLSLSYGKDSLACLGAIEELGLPLDRIVHAEVWATDTIPADLPPMVEFKQKADAIIKDRYGIEVEHFRSKHTYDSAFYLTRGRSGRESKFNGVIYGFPMVRGQWCLQQLKLPALRVACGGNCVQYIGIAVDEPNRFHNLSEKKRSPLVEAGWTEQKCWEWCEQNDLLSPIYTTATRGGCWFCHNQGVNQLRLLRNTYPEYWQILLKWDRDSPVIFKPDGHTVQDYDRRFQMEDDGIVPQDRTFRWEAIDNGYVSIWDLMRKDESDERKAD